MAGQDLFLPITYAAAISALNALCRLLATIRFLSRVRVARCDPLFDRFFLSGLSGSAICVAARCRSIFWVFLYTRLFVTVTMAGSGLLFCSIYSVTRVGRRSFLGSDRATLTAVDGRHGTIFRFGDPGGNIRVVFTTEYTFPVRLS